MPLKSLLFLFFALLTAAAETETLILAYYIGKHPPSYWIDGAFNDSPFDQQKEPRPKPVEIPSAPFSSPFFDEGDRLWDFKSFYQIPKSAYKHTKHLIYNETTGRLVAQTSHPLHRALNVFCHSLAMAERQEVHLSCGLYLIQTRELDSGDLTEIPTDAQEISLTQFTTRSGQRTKLRTNNLEIEWEANWGGWPPYIDHRFSLFGAINKQGIHYQTGFVTREAALIVELGTFGSEQQTLVLKIDSTLGLFDGPTFRQLVLDQEANDIPRRFELFDSDPLAPVDEDGLIYHTRMVPPSTYEFLNPSGDNSYVGADPFADDENVDLKPPATKHIFKGDLSERIFGSPTDQLIDLRQLLEAQGLEMEKREYAILNISFNTISSALTPENAEKLDGIFMACCGDPPIDISSKLILVETKEQPTEENLSGQDLTILARLGSISRPGQKTTTQLGDHLIELEPNIGAGDSIIDLRLHFRHGEEEKPILQVSGGTSLLSEKPKIYCSQKVGDRWLSLLIEARRKTIH